jgi:hypothetical protein
MVACALRPTSARAGDEEEALIRTGLELRREHRDSEALTLFQRAYGLQATPKARAQIGLAEQSLGQWVAAESDLQAALDTDDAWITRNRESLDQARWFVSAHLGWLIVSSNVQASLMLDGANVGTLPMRRPVRLAIGTVVLRVEANGYLPVERQVQIVDREPVHELVDLVSRAKVGVALATAESPPVGRTPPTPAPMRPPSRPLPWAALGVGALGVAAMAVGSGFGVEVLTGKAARDQHCDAGRCDPKGLSLDSEARQAATVSTVAFGVGAAALLAGAWLLLRETSSQRSANVAAAAAPGSIAIRARLAW